MPSARNTAHVASERPRGSLFRHPMADVGFARLLAAGICSMRLVDRRPQLRSPPGDLEAVRQRAHDKAQSRLGKAAELARMIVWIAELTAAGEYEPRTGRLLVPTVNPRTGQYEHPDP